MAEHRMPASPRAQGPIIGASHRGSTRPQSTMIPPVASVPVAPAVPAPPVCPAPAVPVGMPQVPVSAARLALKQGHAQTPSSAQVLSPSLLALSSCPVKPSGAVQALRDAGVAGATKETVEMALLEMLALNNMSVETIYQGEPELFPVLFQFRNHFTDLASRVPPENAVLSLTLPRPDFPIPRKTFRVDNRLNPSQLLTLACDKLTVGSSELYALYTLKGCRLPDEEPMLTFGFGLLFKSWELQVRRVPQSTESVESEALAALSHASPGRIITEGEPLTLYFPPLLNQLGLHKKVFRLSSADLRMPIDELQAQLLEKIGLSDSQRFQLMTVAAKDKSPLLLIGSLPLQAYGLGWRFHKWELKVIFKDLTVSGCVPANMSMTEFPWLDVPNALPTFEDALVIVRHMERRLMESEKARSGLVEKATKAHNRIKELKEGFAQMAGEQETLADMRERVVQLQEELAEVYGREKESAQVFSAYEHEAQQQISAANVRVSELARKLEDLKTEHAEALAHIAQQDARLAQISDRERSSALTDIKLQAITTFAIRLQAELAALKASTGDGAHPPSSPEAQRLQEEFRKKEQEHAVESDALFSIIEQQKTELETLQQQMDLLVSEKNALEARAQMNTSSGGNPPPDASYSPLIRRGSPDVRLGRSPRANEGFMQDQTQSPASPPNNAAQEGELASHMAKMMYASLEGKENGASGEAEDLH